MSKDFVSKPCPHCPYRRDITPYLTYERGEELAYLAENPYNSFTCHLTTVEDEYSDEGNMLVTENSKECAGLLTMRAIELGEDNVFECSEGFKPAYDIIYDGRYGMLDAYEEHHNL